jgi:hypothetical protein
MVTRPRAHWFPLSTFLCFTYLSLFYTPSPKFCFGDYQAAIPHPPGGRQGVLSRGKVPLYHLIKTPVEPPGRMTAAVEASSIRAPDVPVTIHYSTAPVPRYLRLPSTTAPPLCPGVSSYHPLHSYRTVGSPRRRRRPVILPPKRRRSTATRKQHRRVSQPFLARVCSFRGVCDLQQ